MVSEKYFRNLNRPNRSIIPLVTSLLVSRTTSLAVMLCNLFDPWCILHFFPWLTQVARKDLLETGLCLTLQPSFWPFLQAKANNSLARLEMQRHTLSLVTMAVLSEFCPKSYEALPSSKSVNLTQKSKFFK